ncbi:C4-dicarboxylate transporter DctQ subunit [Scopulibacillus darangshiensis]|uniref:C4-dicarboxylate transporter DctQ subunit n=1 Tax=Scopulibacillus darangshiensis TaxID=442528 RepID=A0A4R2NA83_9BACL|nr:TRAP transporter small permease [Scopulibacillus darangshiensis]TCP17902.1 C4-dicarboxylate transporter DctQ subunit [Scopulibacillus darangshiensis]
MRKIYKYYSLFEDLLSGLFMIAGFLLMMYEVIMRYVFNSPTTWINEVSSIIVVWAVLLGLSLTLREGRHISVDLLYVALPRRIQKIFDTFANIVGALFCIFFTNYGIVTVNQAYSTHQLSIETGVPMWIYYVVIPISGVMFLLRFIENIVKIYKKPGVATADNEGEGEVLWEQHS